MKDSELFKTDHLNHYSVFCLAPGLFRSVPMGTANKMLMDVSHEIPGQGIYHFIGPVLTTREMRVLQGVVALSAVGDEDGKRLLLPQNTSTDSGKEHRRTLELDGAAVRKDAIVAETTFYELAKEIGFAASSFHSGPQVRQLRAALERLWCVSIITEDLRTGERECTRLLSRYKSSRDGKFMVAINCHIAETILGIRKKYTRIAMGEIRALKTDSTRLIHQRLCGWIDPGKTGRVGVEVLCGYIWFEPATNVNTMRRRRQFIRKALGELEALGWTVVEYVAGKFDITRRGLAN